MEQFFKKLKEIRAASPFTQQQMGDKLGISLKQYQNYEKKTVPPHEKLLKLNEILKFDFSKILYQDKVLPESGTKKLALKEYSHQESQNVVSDYKEKYLTALEEIRDLQKKLLEKDDRHKESGRSLKKAN